MATVVTSVPQVGRVTRSPEHSFHLKAAPWAIVPFMIAPVLPGETLKNLLWQSRVVTDPIKNPLIGWWKEYAYYYVKLRDLEERDALSEMMLDLTLDVSDLRADTDSYSIYTRDGQMNYVAMCRNRIVEEFFRDEGESLAAGVIDSSQYFSAQIKHSSWIDSLTDESTMPDGTVVDNANDYNQTQLDAYRVQWEFLRANKLGEWSFEDYLKTFGVNVARVEPHRPELIRQTSDWQYPSNTVDPATGVPTSAVSWAISERADKDRFFKEPGFIFGVTWTRPKVYLQNLKGAAVGMLDNALAWLPALMKDEVYTSLKTFAGGAGTGNPFEASSNPVLVDIRDLFVYGDQYMNFAVTSAENGVPLPTASFNKKYVADADMKALFVDVAKYHVREDGIVRLSILGTQMDHT